MLNHFTETYSSSNFSNCTGHCMIPSTNKQIYCTLRAWAGVAPKIPMGRTLPLLPSSSSPTITTRYQGAPTRSYNSCEAPQLPQTLDQTHSDLAFTCCWAGGTAGEESRGQVGGWVGDSRFRVPSGGWVGERASKRVSEPPQCIVPC